MSLAVSLAVSLGGVLVVPATGGVAAAAGGAAERVALPTSMAALGDSVTRGFNACGFYVDCTRRSWSTGASGRVQSHRDQLGGLGARLEEVHNLAADGARADSLAAQAAAAVAAKAEYVTIEIGANDACRASEGAMTPVADYRAQVEAALDTLAAGLPGARVFVASVPDVKRLWTVGHGHRAARYAWNKLHVCQSLLANPHSDAAADAARRDRVRARVGEYNQVLAQACQEYGSACRYDGGAVFREPFTLNQISKWDFFHPNVSGQKRLADVTWKAGFRWSAAAEPVPARPYDGLP
jgi:lysophospholipase L1-like esterase